MKKLLLLNGPNINMLGKRDKNIYGSFTLEELERDLASFVEKSGYHLDAFQSNHEGDLVDRLHAADGEYAGIIFNPAAYTHTSIALHDAIEAIGTPVIEVHISNVHKRESFRHVSMTAPACHGQIVGLGKQGYMLAASAFINNF
ncbi:type II 3-dehydroquinate dehydratase [Aciduricibacillus chroicocephali]|uniref:3-dehydroquinate dehydratase n=1 Tax=Aciduricibacillus chroicocephali TaxID=3054939 RepID=A0ABY9KRV6_9BACI|nr:type II 3-dehydroquinate dehydratase [Bacillaceae bacterium 44XB]